MTPELLVIKHLLVRTNYNKYRAVVNVSNTQRENKSIYSLYTTLDLLYEKVQQDQFSLDEFEAFYWLQHPYTKGEEREAIEDLFQKLRNIDISEKLTSVVVEEIRLRAIASQIALAAYEVSIGKSSKEKIETLAAGLSLQEIYPPIESQFITDDLDDLYQSVYLEVGLRWRLPSLNWSLGSIRKGDFGFIFKRPETGGTTLLASELTFMAGQTQQPILWFNNEEQGKKVKLRCYQAAMGADLAELFADRKRSAEQYSALTGNRILIYDDAIISKSTVEAICREQSPSLIVFDQIDKIKGFVEERRDLLLGSIYQWARELAKTYAPVIGVSQADGSAEGIKWLNMDHCADAKTAKQAEADWILGIGKLNESDMENVRYFHLCKNKLVGDPDTDPAFRHRKWDVIIHPHTARYEDVGQVRRGRG